MMSSLRQRLLLLWLTSTVLLISVLWMSEQLLRQQYQLTQVSEQERARAVARALSQHTLNVFNTVQQAMNRLANAATRGSISPDQFLRFANETGMAGEVLLQLSFVDAKGLFVGSNLDPTGQEFRHLDLSDRLHIRAHLQPETVPQKSVLFSNGLFIGEVVLGKVSGKRTLQLSKKVLNPQGEVLGVVVASLAPDYFDASYGKVWTGSGTAVLLVGLDGIIRARVLDSRPSPQVTTIDARTVPLIALSEEGATVGPSADGIDRLKGFSRVGPYPLTVMVSTAKEQAFANWARTRNTFRGLEVILVLITVVSLMLLSRSMQLLERRNLSLALSEEKAQAASRAKSEFLASMSHELRTPLTSIRGFSELLSQRSQEARTRSHAQLIRRAAEHLNQLLTDILDVAKIDAGAMKVKPEPVHLPSLLEDLVGLFGVSAAEKSLKLSWEIAAEAPTQITTDELRLKQILNNLLSNAVKFTSQGRIDIRVEADRERPMIHIDVSDTGPGISHSERGTVFERFEQGHSAKTQGVGGTGLGLSLSRSLAELLQGSLELRPAAALQGACFRLTLPIEPTRPPGTAAGSREEQGRAISVSTRTFMD